MSLLDKAGSIAAGLLSRKGERDVWDGVGRLSGVPSRTRLRYDQRLTPEQSWRLARDMSVLWRGARLIADGFATLPWKVERRKDRRRRGGEWEPVESHDLEVLIEYPNARWTRSALHRYQALQYLITGNALTRIVFQGGRVENQRTDGTPYELWPIDMVSAAPEVRTSEDGVEMIGYAYRRPNGSQDQWLPAQVIHVMQADQDPRWGVGVPEIVQRQIRTDVRAIEWQADGLDPGRPPFAWKDPNAVTPAQVKEIKDKIVSSLRGRGPRDPLVIGAEGGFERLFDTPVEMDLIRSRQELRAEVVQAIGLLPTMFATDAQTENNLRMAITWMWDNAIQPMADLFRDAYNTALIPRAARRDLYITYSLEGVEAQLYRMIDKLKVANEAIDAAIPPNDAYALAGLSENIGEDGDQPLGRASRRSLASVLRPPARPSAAPTPSDSATPSDATATDPAPPPNSSTPSTAA